MGVGGLPPIEALPLLGFGTGPAIASVYFSDGIVVFWGTLVLSGAIEKFDLRGRFAEYLLRVLEGSSVTLLIFFFVMMAGFM